MIIAAENQTRNHSGTLIKAVDTLSSTVKSVIKNAVDNPMISGLYQARAVSPPPSITGRTGRTQGANTLITHARKARTPRDMVYETK